MKVGIGILLALLMAQAGAASAGGWQGRRGEFYAQQDQGRRYVPDRQRNTDRPERRERYERPQRLSDEDRRNLHRDLDKARREIYRPRRDR
jgi:opacity protein-like surface antigen